MSSVFVGSDTTGLAASRCVFAYDADGSVWNASTSAWAGAPAAAADPTAYRISVTEVGGTGRYYAELPAGTVFTELRKAEATVGASTVRWDEEHGDSNIEAELADIAADVAAIKARTDLIRAGSAVRTPYVSPTGRIELTEGFDYDSDGGNALTISEGTAGDWDETALAKGLTYGFVFYARHKKRDTDFTAAAQLTSVGTGTSGLGEFTVELARGSLPAALDEYDYWVYALGDGNGNAATPHYAVVSGSLDLLRGKL